MQTLDQIKAQIAALKNTYVLFTQKEIRYLPEILEDDERILALTSGLMNNRTWLAICTTRRVIFLNRGMIFGLQQTQMNLDRIQAIDSGFGLVFGTIRVWDGASDMVISMVLKSSINPFVKTVQAAMDTYKRLMVHDIVRTASGITPTPHAAQASAPTLVAELERLSKLHESGTLSLDEYEKAKKKLIGS